METILLLIVSTIGIVLVGYVVLRPILRALERPALLFPWKRRQRIAELRQMAELMLAEPLTEDDRLALRRAINTLNIPGAKQMSGPWADSDPIRDAERDIFQVRNRQSLDTGVTGPEQLQER